MRITEEDIQNLINKSFEAMEKAYCPYSDFPVGAALLCKDGTVYTGCNVENAAYPLGVCAEKTAVCKAVSEGHKSFTAIAVVSTLRDSFVTPCGSCRQFIAEFGLDWDVYMTKPDRSTLKMKVIELLPLGFSPEQLMHEPKVAVTTDVAQGRALVSGSHKGDKNTVKTTPANGVANGEAASRKSQP